MVMPTFDFNEKVLSFVERLNRMGVPRCDIADKLGVSHTTVSKYMVEFKLVPAFTRHRHPRRTLDMAKVIELYVADKWSTHRIARWFGWSNSGIGNRLKAAGIQLRDHKDMNCV